MHYQHDDNPHDGSPMMPGERCGPECPLFDPPTEADMQAGMPGQVRSIEPPTDKCKHGRTGRCGDCEVGNRAQWEARR